jgi:hypothetical protein
MKPRRASSQTDSPSRELLAKVAAAKKKADAAAQKAKEAKALFKNARRTHKKTRKTAKSARRDLKVLKKLLAAARLAAKRTKAARPGKPTHAREAAAPPAVVMTPVLEPVAPVVPEVTAPESRPA